MVRIDLPPASRVAATGRRLVLRACHLVGPGNNHMRDSWSLNSHRSWHRSLRSTYIYAVCLGEQACVQRAHLNCASPRGILGNVMAIIGGREEHVDPRLTRIGQADTKKWYRKRNLRFLYLILVPTALGVEWTSGFDSSMMNSLQAVKSWVDCVFPSSSVSTCRRTYHLVLSTNIVSRFRQPQLSPSGSSKCHVLSRRPHGNSIRTHDLGLSWASVDHRR